MSKNQFIVLGAGLIILSGVCILTGINSESNLYWYFLVPVAAIWGTAVRKLIK